MEGTEGHEATVILSKDDVRLYNSLIQFASSGELSVEDRLQQIQDESEENTVFVGLSESTKKHPATADELRACLDGQKLTMNRTQQETAYVLLNWLVSKWKNDDGLSREDAKRVQSLNSKLLDIGDELYEERDGREVTLENAESILEDN